MLQIRIIKSQRDIVSICDSSLIGKKFEEGKYQLDLKESFFLGKEVDREAAENILIKMAIEDATFFIVGEEAVKAATNAGIIEESSIKYTCGIPFVLVLL